MTTENKSTLDNLIESFPFPSIRDGQKDALRVLAESFDASVPFTIIEGPTGTGKSGIGLSPAIYSAQKMEPEAGAHYLTSQNSLTKQLVQDFEKYGLVELKGKANYQCHVHGTNCEDGSILSGKTPCEGCPYREAKQEYTSGKLGVTNYTYFMTEKKYVGEIEPREYLICDEAHNIEREVLSLADISISQARCDDIECGKLPRFKSGDTETVKSWLSRVFVPQLKTLIASIELELERDPNNLHLSKRQNLLTSLMYRVWYFTEDNTDEWFAWTDTTNGNLMIRPLSAAEIAHSTLFSGTKNIVMMSATILDFATFQRDLGISASESKVFAIPSDFPVKNRRIVYWPVGSMSANSIEETLPRVAQRTQALLDKYAEHKGIIHTHSYRINSYLMDALGKTPHRYRLLSHTNVKGSREAAIMRHYGSEDPTILVSPSMTEGLDLKGDLSRIQIIPKVPYPFLDPYTRARMERDPKWYQLKTALTLVQETGRSNRSADDYALTVILDSNFGTFLAKNQDILPKWWVDSIEFR